MWSCVIKSIRVTVKLCGWFRSYKQFSYYHWMSIMLPYWCPHDRTNYLEVYQSVVKIRWNIVRQILNTRWKMRPFNSTWNEMTHRYKLALCHSELRVDPIMQSFARVRRHWIWWVDIERSSSSYYLLLSVLLFRWGWLVRFGCWMLVMSWYEGWGERWCHLKSLLKKMLDSMSTLYLVLADHLFHIHYPYLNIREQYRGHINK